MNFFVLMIKRVGNIVIMVLLLIATGGIPVTRHYCGKVEMSFAIYSKPRPCCDHHCTKCHNVFKFSRVNDAFEAGSSIITAQSLTEVVTLQASNCIDLFDNLVYSSYPDLFPQRNVRIADAEHSPASPGNLRC
jgi:hypothetical protein